LTRPSARKRVSRKSNKPQAPRTERAAASRFFLVECVGWAFLAILTIFFLATSWRKWPDPLIDFGHDLYIPWRIAQGALLYRDIDDIYGPLSQYLNAGLFRVFGVGMMVLEGANILVFLAILIVVYLLFRRAWGRFAAFVSSAIFIAVFGFAQYVGIGNYNYAAPYSHESTHGMLVSVLLLLVLVRWEEAPTVRRSFLAGGLLGLAAVLKPEFLLAGALTTLAALLMRWRCRKPVPRESIALWGAGIVLPTLAFAAWFSIWLPWSTALANASRAWLNAAGTARFTSDPVQAGFLGLDHPWQNLAEHGQATLLAALAIASICGLAWLAEQRTRPWQRVAFSAAAILGAGWLSIFPMNWSGVGRCLLGLTLAYVLFAAVSAIRRAPAGPNIPVATLRLMIALLAAALMARMFLNGRIFQYGFYQAALAGMLVPAVMLSELPARLRLKDWGKAVVELAGLALFVPGVVLLAGQSQSILNRKTLPIGRGGDQFYAFPQEIDSSGELVRRVIDWIRQHPGPRSLVVLPEGEMINYLVRMPNPVAPFIFYSWATSEGRSEKVVYELQQRPPDLVVIISRDLSEYGIARYGEAPGKGQEIMRWVEANYRKAESIGGDPLDNRARGALILQRKR
jgi:hypothetical protein